MVQIDRKLLVHSNGLPSLTVNFPGQNGLCLAFIDSFWNPGRDLPLRQVWLAVRKGRDFAGSRQKALRCRADLRVGYSINSTVEEIVDEPGGEPEGEQRRDP